MEQMNRTHTSLYKQVLVIGARQGFITVDSMKLLYKEAPKSVSQIDLQLAVLHAMGQVGTVDELTSAFRFAITEAQVQDCYAVFASAASNLKHRNLVWDFVQGNWESIHERCSASKGILAKIVSSSVSGMNSSASRHLIANFFSRLTKESIADISHTIDECLETIDTNIAWRPKSAEAISWIASNIRS